MDDMVAHIDSHQKRLETLQYDNGQLATKLKTFENLGFQGFPEHVVDLQAAIITILQDLVPTISYFPIGMPGL